MVVENFINSYLPDFYGIEALEELRLSFAQKAKLLPTRRSSGAFVRPGIIQPNAVRNKFGHRLDHQIDFNEIEAITRALAITRTGVEFNSPVEAIEAFAPVACAFLSIPPKHLQ